MRESLCLCAVFLVASVSSVRVAAEPAAQIDTKIAQARSVRAVGAGRHPVAEIPASEAERVRMLRRVAWYSMMRTLKTPSEIPTAVREELRKHARREARLQRIHALAVASRDRSSVRRVEALIAREQLRHRNQLLRVWPAPPAREAAAETTESAGVPPKEDDTQDDEKRGRRDHEDEDEPTGGPP